MAIELHTGPPSSPRGQGQSGRALGEPKVTGREERKEGLAHRRLYIARHRSAGGVDLLEVCPRSLATHARFSDMPDLWQQTETNFQESAHLSCWCLVTISPGG
jgi:hypothetical protein